VRSSGRCRRGARPLRRARALPRDVPRQAGALRAGPPLGWRRQHLPDAVGHGAPLRPHGARSRLHHRLRHRCSRLFDQGAPEELAVATGAEVFSAPKKKGTLDDVYQRIDKELRAQYQLTFRSTSTKGPETFRTIRVEVKGQGLATRTIAGYYPPSDRAHPGRVHRRGAAIRLSRQGGSRHETVGGAGGGGDVRRGGVRGCALRLAVPGPPPGANVELRGVAPGPAFLWIDGSWAWRSRWVWMPGSWVVPRALARFGSGTVVPALRRLAMGAGCVALKGAVRGGLPLTSFCRRYTSTGVPRGPCHARNGGAHGAKCEGRPSR